MSADDYARLSALARAAMHTLPHLAAGLAEELDRAQVLANGSNLSQVVCMGCEVEFRDDSTGRIQKLTLVYPGEADISRGTISVLAPVGTALIGLRAGHSITWETGAGEVRRLTVLSVSEPQPAAPCSQVKE